MADEILTTGKRDWTSAAIWMIGLVFVCGMTYNQVDSMDKRVVINTAGVKENREGIHANELLVTGLKGSVDDIKGDTTEIKGDFKDLRDDFDDLKDFLMQFDYEKEKGHVQEESYQKGQKKSKAS